MKKRVGLGNLLFFAGILAVFAIVQGLYSSGVLGDFWYTLLRIGAVMAIVSVGLNLIYGFNGQFSLGQWGFYAVGAYAAADVTFRWHQLHSASGLVVMSLAVAFVGIAYIGLGRLLGKIRGLDTMSSFAIYLAVTIAAVALAVLLGRVLIDPVTALLAGLTKAVSLQIVFFLAVILAGLVAAEVSFLIGLPILALGSDYFGIATLGFTIIVKVLLDNSDTMLGFEEMKGARGMVGIPKITTWFWVFFFLVVVLVITRNLLHSTVGRAIVSVREDEIAAKAMGINVAEQKTLTFVIGSLFAGIAGGLYAHINGFLHPNTFNFIKSFDPMIIVVFGGLGSISGTVVASFTWALVLEGLLRLVLPDGFETWRFVVYPVLLLVMMLLRPRGLFGAYEFPFLRQIVPPLRRKREQASETASAASTGEGR
jgi:branched-chain amino acid transport system permease protein